MESTNNTQSFTMTRGYKRTKYIAITFFPSIILAYLLRYLAVIGKFPDNPVLMAVVTAIPMVVLGYFLIFRKNHTVKVDGYTVTETNELPKVNNAFRISEIASVKKDLLGDTVLLDADGKRLLTVESSMTNYALFMQHIGNMGK
ncbi:MAG: hypothetical protein IJL71_04585 [Oscillospiraceae bacterium]|nr:hypothetical protein [Oscillospiraceae bacterium]